MTRSDPRLAKRVKLSDGALITRMLDIANGLDDVIRMGRRAHATTRKMQQCLGNQADSDLDERLDKIRNFDLI